MKNQNNKIDDDVKACIEEVLNENWLVYDDLLNQLDKNINNKKEQQELKILIAQTMRNIESILNEYPENCYSIHTEQVQ